MIPFLRDVPPSDCQTKPQEMTEERFKQGIMETKISAVDLRVPLSIVGKADSNVA